jgi:phenylpropionate dioxygenase-like ring-hydroxylating dioxygenase large terminal subunit
MRLEEGRMLPAEAYISPDVLTWELRHLYAGSWTWLGRRDELSPQPAVRVGDIGALMATMSMTGESGRLPIPGVDPTAVEYLHLLPDLLVSAHPDYVMAHRLLPLAPDRTWVECSWYLLPRPDGTVPDASYATDFWDLTNRQDWAACESVQPGLASPHFRPGPFAPAEDAVARLVSLVSDSYRSGGIVRSD